MNLQEKQLRILTSQEGHVLTQNKDVQVLNRIFTKTIYLAANDSPDNWKEIADDEAESIRQQQYAEVEAQKKREEREAKMRELEAQLQALKDESDAE